MNPSDDSVILSALQSAAVVDRRDVGRLVVTGGDRIDFLHRLSTNDVASLKPGGVRGTAFTTEKGRMVDYVTVCVRESSLLLLVSSRAETQFLQWLEKYHIMEDVSFSSLTQKTGMATLVGPKALQVASRIVDSPIKINSASLLNMPFSEVTVISVDDFHTPMVHFVVEKDNYKTLWDYLCLEGEKQGVGVMNAGAYEAFRISRGIPVFGHEISEAFNPYDCGLTHAISFTKGCYIGQEVIARLDTYQKVQRGLVGAVLSDRPDEVQVNVPLNRGTEEIGWLTSLSSIPINGKYPGLAIVKKNSMTGEGDLTFRNGEQNYLTKLVELPVAW